MLTGKKRLRREIDRLQVEIEELNVRILQERALRDRAVREVGHAKDVFARLNARVQRLVTDNDRMRDANNRNPS